MCVVIQQRSWNKGQATQLPHTTYYRYRFSNDTKTVLLATNKTSNAIKQSEPEKSTKIVVRVLGPIKPLTQLNKVNQKQKSVNN